MPPSDGLPGLVADPQFQALPIEQQRRVASAVEPALGQLDGYAQDRILTRLAPDPMAFTEQRHGLPTGILSAIQGVESGGDPNAVSPTGVRGAFQITGPTGRAYGLPEDQWTDPLAQLSTAGHIMAGNLKQAKGDLREAVALYGDHNEPGYADKVLQRWQTSGSTTTTGGAQPSWMQAAGRSLADVGSRTLGAVGRIARGPDYSQGIGQNLMQLVGDFGRASLPVVAPGLTAAEIAAQTIGRRQGMSESDAQNAGNVVQIGGAVAPIVASGALQLGRMLSPQARALDRYASAFSPAAQAEYAALEQGPPRSTLGTFLKAVPPDAKALSQGSRDLRILQKGATAELIPRTIKMAAGTAVGSHFGGGVGAAIGAMIGAKTIDAAQQIGGKVMDLAFNHPQLKTLAEQLMNLNPGSPGFQQLAAVLLSHLGIAAVPATPTAPAATGGTAPR